MKRHSDHNNSDKGKRLVVAGLQLRGLVSYSHGREHGNMQTDIVVEMLLRVLLLGPQAAGRKSELLGLS